MKTEESGQRRSGHFIPTSQEPEDGPADQRNHSCDFGSDLGRKKSKLVPWQEVPAESKADRKQQQEHTGKPGYLPWLSVRPHEVDAEHVDKQRGDHKVGRPAVNGSDQPTELYLGDDELNAFKS